MNIIEKYKSALQDIYNHLGFKEDWSIFPIDDSTSYIWRIDITVDSVSFWESKEQYDKSEPDYMYPNTKEGYYQNEIMTHCHYPKNIYIGDEFTGILVNTHTDGNEFLQVFDNSKRIYS